MNGISAKNILSKDILPGLKEAFPYFSFEDVKKLLTEKGTSITNSTLKTYLYMLKKEKKIFDAGNGWYSFIEKSFTLNAKPVRKVVKTIKQKLPLLPFSCWSTEQLNPFTHHVLSKFVTFVYIDSDFVKNVAESLREFGYNVYENPNKVEIEKQFHLTNQTIVIRPIITKQPCNNENTAPIEKILVDFLIENQKFKIMERSEAEKVVGLILVSGRINIATLFSYSKRRRLHILDAINQFQKKNNAEMVD